MKRFEKQRQGEDETIDNFLDDLEMLRRRSQPDETNRRINLAVASKFIIGVKNDELRTKLATYYSPLSTIAPTPEALRVKSKEYKEHSERLSIAKAEHIFPAGKISRGQSPMELLNPRELSQTTEVRVPTGSGKVTIPDSSEILGDPGVEKTMRQLVESAGQLVAKRFVPGSGVTAPYRTIDDTGRVDLSLVVITKT